MINAEEKEYKIFSELIKAISNEEDIQILEQMLNYYEFIKDKKQKNQLNTKER